MCSYKLIYFHNHTYTLPTHLIPTELCSWITAKTLNSQKITPNILNTLKIETVEHVLSPIATPLPHLIKPLTQHGIVMTDSKSHKENKQPELFYLLLSRNNAEFFFLAACSTVKLKVKQS